MMKKPILQVALDFVDLNRAIKIADLAVKGGADWLEVGTPLIKSEGLNAIKVMRKNFPKKKIVADMKVIDTGRLEIEAAAKSGADIVVVLGVADDSTIKECVSAANNYGCEIMVDLLNCRNLESRALEVEKFGVDYICVHVGIDQQMIGVDPIQELKKITKKVRVPLAIAGGINSETAVKAVENGAEIVVVGGAITKAKNVEKATREIKEAILKKRIRRTFLYKKHLDPVKVFKKVSTANISDAMHRAEIIEGVKPILNGVKIVGRAVTVRTYPGDWAKPVEAIDIAKEGDVIVIDALGSGKAVWGELASWSCKLKGIEGVVIYGSVRDVEEIRKLKFPVFAKNVTSTAGEPLGLGEINVPIKIGAVTIKPGDYIIGDEDGVIVVPKENAIEVANRALDIFEKEIRIREEIKEGSSLGKILELEKWEKVRK